MMGGKAPMALGTMWTFVAVAWIFVVFRLYTRIRIKKGVVGPDDYAYVLSGVLLLLYTVFIHISANHGFGQPMPGPDAPPSQLDEAALAIKYEMIGQTFAVIGMAVAKMSIGLFLLRLVVVRWHKVLIWVNMVSLLAVSIMTAIVFWVQCTPVTKIFDRVRVPGTCKIDVTPIAITLGVFCILEDFFFAIFPLFFILKLNMKHKEKVTIAGSMSLGVIAGVCGIVRTYEVATGFTANYTLDTVPLIIWSAAEMVITLVCNGIPTLRPFWRQVMCGSKISSDIYYKSHGDRSEQQAYPMDDMPQSKDRDAIGSNSPGACCQLDNRETRSIERITGNNPSTESILGAENRRMAEGSAAQNRRIQVQKGVKVTSWSAV